MKGGDTFEETLARYSGLIFTLCRRFSRQGAEVDDLAQEVAVMLWRRREELLGIDIRPKQAAWVWRVGTNAAIDYLRRYPQHEPLPNNWDSATDDRSQLEALHELIDRLPDLDRTIVELHLQGYSYEEIANRVQLSEKNVSVRLVRIKDKLRKGMTT